MISVYVRDFNGFINQDIYDDIINNVNLNTVKCSCGHYGVELFAYYKRYIITVSGRVYIRITRVKCPFCNRSHALLTSFIIPYSHVLLDDQIRIIKNDDTEELMIEKPDIDENCISRIRRNYNWRFRERLLSFGFSFEDDVVLLCSRYFRSNFNQIRRCDYVLYS